MGNNWFFFREGQRVGPVDFDLLKQLVKSGVVQPKDEVWNEGGSTRVPAELVPGLADTGSQISESIIIAADHHTPTVAVANGSSPIVRPASRSDAKPKCLRKPIWSCTKWGTIVGVTMAIVVLAIKFYNSRSSSDIYAVELIGVPLFGGLCGAIFGVLLWLRRPIWTCTKWGTILGVAMAIVALAIKFHDSRANDIYAVDLIGITLLGGVCGAIPGLFLGVLLRITIWWFYGEPSRCTRCGQKISFWADSSSSICNNCVEARRQRLEESTSRLVDEAQLVATTPPSGHQCPKCRSHSIAPASKHEAGITLLASLSFEGKRCRECRHVWIIPRSEPFLIALSWGIVALMLGIVVCWIVIFTTITGPPSNAVTRGLGFGVLFSFFLEAWLCRALFLCIKAIKMKT